MTIGSKAGNMAVASQPSMLFRSAIFALVALVVLPLSIATANLAAQTQTPTLRVRVDLQPIAVRVTDKQGNDVLGLSASDFTVLEDGRPQKIAFFDSGNEPVSLAVLVDSSSAISTTGQLGSAADLAAEFLRNGRPRDEIFAMDFTNQLGPFQRLATEQILNPSALNLAPAPGGGSALFDAVASALCHLRGSNSLRQAVIVITNGVDQHSRITLEQLIGLVRSSPAQLFMMGLHSRPEFGFDGREESKLTLVSGRDIDNPMVVFERLAKESGAESFLLNSQGKLNAALRAVSNLLQTQYTPAYYPKDTSKPFRRIQVKVKRPGVKITTRRGVGSEVSGDESVHFVNGTCQVSPERHPYPYESKLTRNDGHLLYREDFSDRGSGWPKRENSRYVKEGYELSANAQMVTRGSVPTLSRRLGAGTPLQEIQVPEDVIAANGPWWTDFRASVLMDVPVVAPEFFQNPAAPDHNPPAAGLVFRLNQDGYYALLLSGTGDWKDLSFRLVKKDYASVSDAEIVPLTPVADFPRSSRSSRGVKISVENMGDKITLFFNGRPVKSVRDESHSGGYLGFIATGRAGATFHDLVVQELP